MTSSSINKNVIVIGAGPAGLMAAGQAALRGANVTILEKMAKPAIKLSITGNGRCNLTNAAPLSTFKSQIFTNYQWVKHALFSFTNTDLQQFFETLGVRTIVENEGTVFPASGHASDICDALIHRAKANHVQIQTQKAVAQILVDDQHQITGVKIKPTENKPPEIIHAHTIILATGGQSYPKTGSTGDGYQLAKAIGHTITPIQPALIAIETDGTLAQELQGLSWQNAKITVWSNQKKQASDQGDILFTHFGLSGPEILSISRHIVSELAKKNEVTITIDLFPKEDDAALDSNLIQTLKKANNQLIQNALKSIVPPKLIATCLNQMGIEKPKKSNEITAVERKKLRIFLKNIPLKIKSTRPLAEAIVTHGGINTTEIDPKTMASKIIKGLYFAGEIIDIDANTGGFNLQMAFSTGWLAGNSVLGKCKNSRSLITQRVTNASQSF